MRIAIIYDNKSYREGFKSSWGFSCLLEIGDKKILFDTGADGPTLLFNMGKSNINPKEIDSVFISHPHWDHTGGLNDFIHKNKNIDLFLPTSMFEKYDVKHQLFIEEPCEIYPNIFSTGTLAGIEQSLVVKIDKGLIVVVGCSHPGVDKILYTAEKFGKVYGLIGGLHAFKEFDLIKDLELICPTHCTQYRHRIEDLYPDKVIQGGTGRVIVS